MNQEQQREAIAEICGYERTSSVSGNGPAWQKKAEYFTRIPKYTECLNAMHEAETVIRKNHDIYAEYLQYLNRTAPECRVHANAGQKAEAFLRAIGKWEDDKWNTTPIYKTPSLN